MTIRPATVADLPVLAAMLRAEGVPDCDMRIHDGTTVVLDQGGPRGSFTLETTGGWLHLRHFVVAREHRSPAAARALGRAVCLVARSAGYTEMLVHAKRDTLGRFVRYWFRDARPYGRADDGAVLYRVGIGG